MNLIPKSLLFIACLLMSLQTLAGSLIEVSGKVVGIENKQAILRSASGETRVPLKRLSEKDKKTVLDASISKKEITLYLPVETLIY
jgi:hypothetical protein